LRLLQEWGKGGIKENDGGGEFNYDILQELLQMSQCTPSIIIIMIIIIPKAYRSAKL
jgi:hypothetical protein